MKINRIIFLIMLFSAAYAAFLQARLCKMKQHSVKETVYETVTVHDSFFHTDTVKVLRTFYTPIPLAVDTADILREYFAVHQYRDTIVSMPDLKVTLAESTSQNMVFSRDVQVSWNQRTQFRDFRNCIVLGASLGYQPSVDISYMFRSFGIGAGLELRSGRPFVSLRYRALRW